MSTVATEPKVMNADEFYEWVHRPEHTSRWFELVRGEVIELPPPMKPHGRVCMNSGYLLEGYVRRRKRGYVTCNDSGVILERDPDTVRGPDVALYEDANSFEELHPKYGEVPPRVAVEVLSPNDKVNKVMRKITDYLKAGVALVWLIDPEDRTVTVYRPDKAPYTLIVGQQLTGDDVLPDFVCQVEDFYFVPGEPKDPSQPS